MKDRKKMNGMYLPWNGFVCRGSHRFLKTAVHNEILLKTNQFKGKYHKKIPHSENYEILVKAGRTQVNSSLLWQKNTQLLFLSYSHFKQE